ncbi:hypothetical protein FT663_00086 [Candidozyma haemuli var. vulneris]|nr:hypothetical protein FT662_00252 [[Candida] haemuloni var. vulneris]KAF3995863.1 hypothetical protein FT663_00086 [[Candida] haemuloni var. vulneris]
MDDFQKFHLRKAKRRPLGDISSQVNKPRLKDPKTRRAGPDQNNDASKQHIHRDPPKQHKSTSNLPKPSIGQLSALAKPLHSRPKTPTTGSSAFPTKSLLFDVPPSKKPKFEPRYRDITREVIEPMKDSNELVSQSNSSVRSFTQWYKLQDFSFVAKEKHKRIGDATQTADPNLDQLPIPDQKSLSDAQNKTNCMVPYLVLEAHRIGPYLVAVSLTCTDVREDAHRGIFDVLLMNPDSRIDARQNDKIFLAQEGKFDIRVAGSVMSVYAVWKISKTP